MDKLEQILRNQIIIMEYLSKASYYGILNVPGYNKKFNDNINETKEILKEKIYEWINEYRRRSNF